MKKPDQDEHKIQRVTEIYVAVFPVHFNSNQRAEVILAGIKKDPNFPNSSIVRATVETHADAVPNLVSLCDEIVDEQKDIESYRLLKFDKDGIHILSPDDFRLVNDGPVFRDSFVSAGWGMC